MSGTAAAMVDVACPVEGGPLPREHRRALAAAVEAVLPWLARTPGAGVHPMKGAGSGPAWLLSRRSRLVLRVPRARADDVRALDGRTLAVGGAVLRVGAAQVRELLPWGTLYAPLVVDESGGDELAFLRQVESALQALGVRGRAICGRRAALAADTLQGYSVMVDGLGEAAALRLLEHGLGGERRLGCGLFVPHRSAAAVGAPG